MVDKQTLMTVYRLGTDKPFSFLFVNLNENSLEQMFMVRFSKRIRFGG